MTKNNGNEKKIIIILSIILVLLIAVFGSVYYFSNKDSLTESVTNSSYSDSRELKSYSLEVVDKEKKIKKYSGKTNGKYLINIMDELSEQGDFSYSGEESVYGVYVKEINGVRTEDMTKAYWAFYVNDVYCQHGVSSQPVNDGDSFKIQYEEIG